MNCPTRIRRSLLAAIAVSAAAALAPSAARADASCNALLPGKFSYLQQHGGFYDVEITVTKDSLPYVTYSSGYLNLSGSYLYGSANLQFSDRYNGAQNFNASAAETIRIWISRTGTLWIYNDNYSYYIVSNFEMSCAGGLISKYVPGLGVVTVAIRSWNIIG